MSVKIASVHALVIAPASVFLPGDHGQKVRHDFAVHLRRLSKERRAELHEWLAAGKRPAPDDGGRDAERDADGGVPFLPAHLLDEVVGGWAGMLDEQGQPVPYSHAERRAAEQVHEGVEEAMTVAWYDTFRWVSQRAEKEKNSGAPSPTSSAAAPSPGTATS